MGSSLNNNVKEGRSVNYTQLKDIFANYEYNSSKNISKPQQFKNQETSRLFNLNPSNTTALLLSPWVFFCKRESRGFSKIG